MARTDRDRTLALAGVFQAARLVQQSATEGRCDEAALEASINSIFNTEPKDVESVYGKALCLTLGLQMLERELHPNTRQRNMELMKYVLGVLYLERKLAKTPGMLARIAEGIERARGQMRHFPPTHLTIRASLADTYTQTLSTLSPRIIVHGEHTHLTNPDVANTIRACLLAAIRSAVLWHQCGGSRWRLLVSRRNLVQEARRLLAESMR